MTLSEPQQPRLDVPEGLNRAIEFTRRMMFNPFDFGTWLNIGVMAFISNLAEGGGGFGGANFQFRSAGNDTFNSPEIRAQLLEAKAWVIAHQALIVLIVVGVIVLSAAIGLLLLWLSCRGKMMLLRAVARQDVRIGENWSAVARPAWSLFLFRVSYGLVYLVILALIVIPSLVVVWTQIERNQNHISHYVAVLFPALTLLGLLAVVGMLVSGLLNGLVTPLMYLFDLSCLDAWRRVLALSRGNVLRILLFLVIRVACAIGIGMASLLVGCFTCCIGLLPVVAQTVFAFYYVFERAFSYCTLESLGPEYRVFTPEPGETPPPPPPVVNGPYPGIS